MSRDEILNTITSAVGRDISGGPTRSSRIASRPSVTSRNMKMEEEYDGQTSTVVREDVLDILRW